MNGKVLVDGKLCSSCKEFKTSDNFHKDKHSPSGLAYYCKGCANSKARGHHKERVKNPDWKKARANRQKAISLSNKLKAVSYFGDKCNDCGVTYPHYIYDFHHLDGSTKSDNPSRLLRTNDWESAKEELDKCVMLCSNCHRERHFGG